MEPSAGTRVTDNVTLTRLLGEGGMGRVWLAHHESLDVDVAVKFVSPELADKDPGVLERFKREASLAAKIKSPHVVKIFDHGVTDGMPYIVMEQLDGETLGAKLDRGDRFTLRETGLIVSQVGQVLSEAHALGVVHRDIKPDNVFMIESGYELFVKVLDFGIAKETEVPATAELTSSGAIVGTPEYMSPERLLSTGSADARADLWALAVLAYHVLAGEVPFKGATLPALSISICGGRFGPPSDSRDDISDAVDAWFERAFNPVAEDRFAGIDEMTRSFRDLMGGGSLEQTDTPSGERTPRPSANPVAVGPTQPSAVVTEPDLGAPPVVGVEEARSTDPRRRKAVAQSDEPASAGAHRRDTGKDTLPAGVSPTFSGAAADLDGQRKPRWSRLTIALLFGTVVVLALIADITFRHGDGDEPQAATTAGTASVPPAPPSASSGPLVPVQTSTVAIPTAAIADTPPSARPATSVPVSAVVAPARPPRLPATAKPTPTVDCGNPYVLKADGTLKVRAECLDD